MKQQNWEEKFDEEFLCATNPDSWMPTLSPTHNPLEESEAPSPEEVKSFIFQNFIPREDAKKFLETQADAIKTPFGDTEMFYCKERIKKLFGIK